METHEIPEYTVAATFVRKYLKDKGIPITAIKVMENRVIASENKERLIIWVNSKTISIYDLKEFLPSLNIDYQDFINAYAEKLTTM